MKEKEFEEQGSSRAEVIQPGGPKDPANTDIINHGPLEDYD